MVKEQTIGGIILTICLIVGILYTVGLFHYFGNPLNWGIEFWLIAIPVFLAFIMMIGMWIWILYRATTKP